MNVLFLCHPESDYGGAFLFNGLCQALGSGSVWEFPMKRSYHGETHRYALPDIPNGMTAPLPWMQAWTAPYDAALPEEEYAQQIERQIDSGFFNLVVVESPRQKSVEAAKRFRSRINAANLRVVMHDGEDYTEFNGEAVCAIQPDLILKREMLLSEYASLPGFVSVRGKNTRVVPFPFSFPCSDPVKNAQFSRLSNDHPFDVVFMCGNTDRLRQAVADALRNALGSSGWRFDALVEIEPDDTPGFTRKGLFPWANYLRTMTESKMGVSVRGFGRDTCRYWEVPYCTVLLRDTLDIHIPYDFQDGVHCLTFRTADECVQKVCDFKDRRDELTQLYERGRAHLLAHHTNEARAMQMIAHVEELP